MWKQFEGYLKHQSEDVWTGLDFDVTRAAMRGLFRQITYYYGTPVGKQKTIWVARLGRAMEQWSVKHVELHSVAGELLKCSGFFYLGNEDGYTDLERAVLWAMEQLDAPPAKQLALLDARAVALGRSYEVSNGWGHDLDLLMDNFKSKDIHTRNWKENSDRILKEVRSRLRQKGRIS